MIQVRKNNRHVISFCTTLIGARKGVVKNVSQTLSGEELLSPLFDITNRQHSRGFKKKHTSVDEVF